MLIAEDLLLLLYDDKTGRPITGSPGLDYALAGGVLIQLAALGKVDIAGDNESTRKGRLVVKDPSSTGDPILDQRLAIVVTKAGSKPAGLIGKLSKKLRQQLLTRLVGNGVLLAEKGKILGLFPVTCWRARDARHKAELLVALDNALNACLQPNDRTAALIALLNAVNVVPKVVTSFHDRKQLKRRAKEISEAVWAADAVKEAVRAMEAAVTAG